MYEFLRKIFATSQRPTKSKSEYSPTTLSYSLEFSESDPKDFTPRESFEYQLGSIADYTKTIDGLTGKWITNTIPRCRAVLGDHGKLRAYDRKSIKRLTGSEAQTYHEAAAVLIERLRRLEAAGMAEPFEVREKKAREAKRAALEAAKKSKQA